MRLDNQLFFEISPFSISLFRQVVRKKKKNEAAAAAAKVEVQETLQAKVAKNLGSEKWKAGPTNMRIRCNWCHKTFDHNDDVTTLRCNHSKDTKGILSFLQTITNIDSSILIICQSFTRNA